MKSLKRILLVITLTTIIGYIDQKASAETNTTDLKMPLKLQLAPPAEGWFYRGRFSQEGDGPLGQGDRSVRANLTIERTASFPAEVTFRMDVNNVLIRHPDLTCTKANPNDVPELAALGHVQMDRYGHTPGTYNPNEFPLSLIGDLWPLPPVPIDKDDDYIENVESKDQAGPLRFKGTRKIIFHKTRMFKGVLCAILESQTNLDFYYANRQNFPPLQLNIDSHIVFDMQANWPRSVHQDITYAGKARQKDGNLRDFDWQMEWDLHRHKLKPPQPPPPEPEEPPAPLLSVSAGEVITPLSVKVGGMRLIRHYDKERGIKPLHRQNGYTLSLILELPEPNLKIIDGRVEKAVTDTGQDILPERRRYTSSHKLSKDKKAVVFDVELSLPHEAAKGLAELSGVLLGFKFTGTKKIDLGIIDFKGGTKSKVDGFSIKSIKKKPGAWEKGNTYMHIGINLPRGSIKDVKLYREDGMEIKTFFAGSSYRKDRLINYNIRTKGEFPPTGRIVFEVLDKITKHKIPFKLTNISLLGQPL